MSQDRWILIRWYSNALLAGLYARFEQYLTTLELETNALILAALAHSAVRPPAEEGGRLGRLARQDACKRSALMRLLSLSHSRGAPRECERDRREQCGPYLLASRRTT